VHRTMELAAPVVIVVEQRRTQSERRVTLALAQPPSLSPQLRRFGHLRHTPAWGVPQARHARRSGRRPCHLAQPLTDSQSSHELRHDQK